MSVLIKGAKMPANCMECAGKRPTFNGVYCWVISLPIHDLSCRHPDCPLVEIPPHGRPIDADKKIALELLNKYQKAKSDNIIKRGGAITKKLWALEQECNEIYCEIMESGEQENERKQEEDR